MKRLALGRRAYAVAVGLPLLRSLDAIHLASALAVSDELDTFCCYDERRPKAARPSRG